MYELTTGPMQKSRPFSGPNFRNEEKNQKLLKRLLLPQPLPHPPHRHSKMMIQVMVLHPHPELEDVLDVHPHPVAVKSLMLNPPN